MKAGLYLWSLLLLAACRQTASESDLYGLPGVWTLSCIEYPWGDETHYPDNGKTFCRIFDGRDTTFYDCCLLSTPSGIVVIPHETGNFDLVNKGQGEFLYLENGDVRPLTKVNDTTLVIQKRGRRYTWIHNRSMTKNRVEEIRRVVSMDTGNADGEVMRYVLSTSERELQATNRVLVCMLSLLALAVLLALRHLVWLARRKKQVEEQLRQITEERELRPTLVQNALRQVEEGFFGSDYYKALHRRVATGEMLRPADWEDMERETKPVYPNFFRQLPGLCKMSSVEYRVCLLIKLRFSPSEIAAVLCKDISSISSIRGRLYKKVFNRKGGAKEWDDFILSL
jgi:hypothetical protein